MTSTAAEPRSRTQVRRIVTVLAAGVVAQLALIACFVGAMSNPTLHKAPLAVVSGSGAAAPSFGPAGALDVRQYASADKARTATERGDVAGAVIVAPGGETLLVAGASTPALAGAITLVVQAQARAAGVPLQVEDVRPLPANDPKGLGTFLLTIGWVVGGYLGAMLLTRAVGPGARSPRGTTRLLGWIAGYAVASAALGVLLVDPVMNVVTGHGWLLAAVGALVVFAVASFTTALMSLLGVGGLILAVGTLVLLGNPTSGGSVPDEMLSGGWRFLAKVLPTNAAVRLVRTVQYFDNRHTGVPGLVIALFAVCSVAALVTTAAVRDRRSKVITPLPTLAPSGVE